MQFKEQFGLQLRLWVDNHYRVTNLHYYTNIMRRDTFLIISAICYVGLFASQDLFGVVFFGIWALITLIIFILHERFDMPASKEKLEIEVEVDGKQAEKELDIIVKRLNTTQVQVDYIFEKARAIAEMGQDRKKQEGKENKKRKKPRLPKKKVKIDAEKVVSKKRKKRVAKK